MTIPLETHKHIAKMPYLCLWATIPNPNVCLFCKAFDCHGWGRYVPLSPKECLETARKGMHPHLDRPLNADEVKRLRESVPNSLAFMLGGDPP